MDTVDVSALETDFWGHAYYGTPLSCVTYISSLGTEHSERAVWTSPPGTTSADVVDLHPLRVCAERTASLDPNDGVRETREQLTCPHRWERSETLRKITSLFSMRHRNAGPASGITSAADRVRGEGGNGTFVPGDMSNQA